jgi:hypothetical protein
MRNKLANTAGILNPLALNITAIFSNKAIAASTCSAGRIL